MRVIATLLRFLPVISLCSAAHLYNRDTTLFSRDVKNTIWAGAVYDNQKANSFSGVSGVFTLPSPSSGPCLSTILVGLDGAYCDTSLMAGVDVGYNGSIIYTALYGWYPNAHTLSNFPLHPGDQIQVTVDTTDGTTGSVTFTNVNEDYSMLVPVSGTDAPICGNTAEWVVQQSYIAGGSQVTLCDFGAVTFTNTTAFLTAGGTMTASQANTWEIVDDSNGNQLTTVTITSDSNVDIAYQIGL